MGMLGGLAAGFLGAGLLGMLFGGGMFSGLGGLSSIIGLILQIGLIIIVVRLAMSWWQRRHTPASAYAGQAPGAAAGPGGPLNSSCEPDPASAWDRAARRSRSSRPTTRPSSGCSARSRAAWSNEDVEKLHTLATPEMVSYFTKDLEENKANNDINKVSDVKLLQGDLAEAWREGETDYASVAMRFSLVDKTLERGTDPSGRGQRAADRGDRGLDLRAAARRQTGNSRRSSDSLIACNG